MRKEVNLLARRRALERMVVERTEGLNDGNQDNGMLETGTLRYVVRQLLTADIPLHIIRSNWRAGC